MSKEIKNKRKYKKFVEFKKPLTWRELVEDSNKLDEQDHFSAYSDFWVGDALIRFRISVVKQTENVLFGASLYCVKFGENEDFLPRFFDYHFFIPKENKEEIKKKIFDFDDMLISGFFHIVCSIEGAGESLQYISIKKLNIYIKNIIYHFKNMCKSVIGSYNCKNLKGEDINWEKELND